MNRNKNDEGKVVRIVRKIITESEFRRLKFLMLMGKSYWKRI